MSCVQRSALLRKCARRCRSETFACLHDDVRRCVCERDRRRVESERLLFALNELGAVRVPAVEREHDAKASGLDAPLAPLQLALLHLAVMAICALKLCERTLHNATPTQAHIHAALVYVH